jgi:type VI secretion system protein VasD
LYSNDVKTLGPALVSRKEIQIGPSESREIIEKLQPGTRAIGVVAAFRNLSSNQWRAVIPVQEGKSIPVQLNLGQTSISVKASGN